MCVWFLHSHFYPRSFRPTQPFHSNWFSARLHYRTACTTGTGRTRYRSFSLSLVQTVPVHRLTIILSPMRKV